MNHDGRVLAKPARALDKPGRRHNKLGSTSWQQRPHRYTLLKSSLWFVCQVLAWLRVLMYCLWLVTVLIIVLRMFEYLWIFFWRDQEISFNLWKGAVSCSIIIIIIIIIVIIIIINENPQLVVQLPPQSTTHKTLGVMTKDVSGKLALPQFRRKKKGQTDTKGLQSGFFYLIHYNLLKRIL